MDVAPFGDPIVDAAYYVTLTAAAAGLVGALSTGRSGASVGATVIMLLCACARLLQPAAAHETDAPSDEDLDAAARVIATQSAVSPNLVFLRDKALLFDEARRAFLMYAVRGRTWAALGDPVGPPDCAGGLIRAFVDRCTANGGIPAFYEIGESNLSRYTDVGLSFVKIGETARVDLERFTFDGAGRGAKNRQLVRRLAKDGGSFSVLAPADVAAVMSQLRQVSDEWLEEKAAGEKRFSLGFFDEAYLARFPAAIVEREGRIEAFANLWCGADGDELAIDLMRFRRSAPTSTMEALFVHVMHWAQAAGYRWCSLGMAPMSGLDHPARTTMWTTAGSLLYRHGGPRYNFQGLRAFKEKFDPVWAPRYLAYAGGLTLPRVIADVSALIAGGYRRIFVR